MAARGEQDLKHLLGPGAPQVTRTERAGAVFDHERPEQPDHRAPPTLFFYAHALPPSGDRGSVSLRHGCLSSLGSVSSRARLIYPAGRVRGRAAPSASPSVHSAAPASTRSLS